MGTPQGAIVSPVLANVFLHYVLDLWFHKKWRPNVPDGEAIIVRYADDIVVGFQHKRDAERYLRDVRERLARFGLSLHQDKTRLVEFGRFADLNRRQRGVGKPETFDFLGLTHYCTTTLRGRFRLGRKPVAKRVNRTLARIDEVLRKRLAPRHLGSWVGGWGESAMAGSTTLPSQGQAGSSVRSSAGCNAGGCGRYAAGPSEPDSVGSDWSA